MKIPVLLLLLSFVAADCFAQENKSERQEQTEQTIQTQEIKQAFTTASHYRRNISLRNPDGTRTNIYINGNSASLVNADGTRSTIDFQGKFSTIYSIDGTISTVVHNGMSSTVHNSDGTQFFVSHMQTRSTCSAVAGTHTITHNFGYLQEISRNRKTMLDVLIHSNWLARVKMSALVLAEMEAEETVEPER